MNPMKKLPIGIQTFEKIREDDFVYIDKTSHALRLIDHEGGYYFLSRPRRFGKSLFLSTLKSIFDNRRDLFEGLHIYERYAWETKYPVIHISFIGSRGLENLRSNLGFALKRNQEELGIACEETEDHATCFGELIVRAQRHYDQKVVVLIDEYDKGILDNIDDTETAKEAREILKRFYSVLKESDAYLRFVFITGVSKFSKVSLFSGLNNLEDITLNPNYATICGYTQSDIEKHFQPWFEKYAIDLEEIKVWYNGYKWLGEGLYNPFGFLNFLAKNGIFENYWFGSATPTFLLKLIEQKRYYIPDFESITVDNSILDSFDIDTIELETLMWQSGYLTITDVKAVFMERNYVLRIPNREVRLSLHNHIFDLLTKTRPRKLEIYEIFMQNDLDGLRTLLEKLFSSIPYNNFTGVKLYNYEGYYASVIYSFFASLGIELIAEDVTDKGRIDLTLKIPREQKIVTYIFEFKVIDNETGDGLSALAQIKTKQYAKKYDGEIWLVGIEFGKPVRNVVGFAFEFDGQT